MEKRIKYNKYDSGKTFFLSIIAPQIVAILFVMGIMVVASLQGTTYEALSESLIVTIFSVVIAQLAFVVVFFMYNKYKKIDYIKATGVSFKASWRNYVGCILIAVIAMFGFNNIVCVVDQVFKLIGYNGATSLPLPLDNIGWLLFNLLFLAVIPAVFEELIFRGIIFQGLKQYGKIKAVFISAFLFMIMHGTIVQTVYPFILGIVLAFVMLKTKNIIFPMLLHFANNATVIIFSYITRNQTTENVNLLNFKEISLAILFAVVSALAIFVIIKFVIKSKEDKKISLKDIKLPEGAIDFEQAATNNQAITVSEQSGLLPNKFLVYGTIIAIAFWILDLIMGFTIV